MLHLRPASNSSCHGPNQSQSQPPRPTVPQSQPFIASLNNSSTSQSQTFATMPVAETAMESATSSGKTVVFPVRAARDSSVVLLSTAIVKIADYNGNVQFARALLDCCSERNLLSERLAQKLDRHDPLSLQGVGPSAASSKQSAMAIIRSCCTDYAVDLKFHILLEFKPILPSNRLPIANWNIPSFVQLADPRFFEPNQIDAIIGAEHGIILDLTLKV